MRKTLIVMLIMLMAVSLSSCKSDNDDKVEAGNLFAGTEDLIVDYEINVTEDDVEPYEGKLLVDDVEIPNVKMLMIGERVIIPINVLRDELNLVVEWEGAGKRQRIYIINGDDKFYFKSGTNQFLREYKIAGDEETKRYQEAYSETPSMYYKGTMYIPLRFVAVNLGYKVDWDSNNNIVNIWNKQK